MKSSVFMALYTPVDTFPKSASLYSLAVHLPLLHCFFQGALPPLHLSPADIAINIIHQKQHKANHYRQVADILGRCQDPKNDQYNIIGSIC